MAKKENVKTTIVTTTVTTTVTINETTDKAVYIMPIDFITEPGAEKYYKQRGINVRKVNIFGTDVLCAFIDDAEYAQATPERKAEILEKSKAFTKAMSDDRRHRAYHDSVARKHESSLDTLIDAGYDPSADSIDVAIKISKKVTESETDDDGSTTTESKQDDDDRFYGKKPVNKTSYGKSSSRVSQLLSDRPELTGTNREKLLSAVQDEKLATYINEIYRPGASIGDGGTADALISEYYSGSSKHLAKAQERLIGINKIINSGNLSLNDLDIAEALRDDLEYAIGLFK